MALQRSTGWFAFFAMLFGASLALAGDKDKDKDRDKEKSFDLKFGAEFAPPAIAPAPRAAMKSMGATPGGAKDIDYARDRILAGEVPHASTFTSEGLFSQYDLPLPSKRACTQILCLSGAATTADLIAQP